MFDQKTNVLNAGYTILITHSLNSHNPIMSIYLDMTKPSGQAECNVCLMGTNTSGGGQGWGVFPHPLITHDLPPYFPRTPRLYFSFRQYTANTSSTPIPLNN